MPCTKGPRHEMQWSIISDWTKHPSFILSFIHHAQEIKKKKKVENQQLTPLPTMAMEHSIRRVCCKLLSHSLVNAHLGCFQTWAIVHKAIISKHKEKNCREAGEGSVEAYDKNHCWHVGQRRWLTQPGKYHTPAVKCAEVWEDQDQVGGFPPNGLLVNMSPGNESTGLTVKQ